MKHWVFLDYVSPAGNNAIADWTEKELTLTERQEFETLLEILTKKKQWSQPEYKPISGHPGLGEIRWKSSEGTPLRVACIKGPGPGEYTLLMGFAHKDKVYDPPKPFVTATKRKKLLARKEATTCEHEEDDGEAGEV